VLQYPIAGDANGCLRQWKQRPFIGLVYIWLTMCLRSPQTARPCGLRAEAGGRREIFVRIHGHRSLYDFV